MSDKLYIKGVDGDLEPISGGDITLEGGSLNNLGPSGGSLTSAVNLAEVLTVSVPSGDTGSLFQIDGDKEFLNPLKIKDTDGNISFACSNQQLQDSLGNFIPLVHSEDPFIIPGNKTFTGDVRVNSVSDSDHFSIVVNKGYVDSKLTNSFFDLLEVIPDTLDSHVVNSVVSVQYDGSTKRLAITPPSASELPNTISSDSGKPVIVNSSGDGYILGSTLPVGTIPPMLSDIGDVPNYPPSGYPMVLRLMTGNLFEWSPLEVNSLGDYDTVVRTSGDQDILGTKVFQRAKVSLPFMNQSFPSTVDADDYIWKEYSEYYYLNKKSTGTQSIEGNISIKGNLTKEGPLDLSQLNSFITISEADNRYVTKDSGGIALSDIDGIADDVTVAALQEGNVLIVGDDNLFHLSSSTDFLSNILPDTSSALGKVLGVVSVSGNNQVDWVDISSATGGVSTLGDLVDVDLTGAVDGDVLSLNSTSGLWEPKAVTSGSATSSRAGKGFYITQDVYNQGYLVLPSVVIDPSGIMVCPVGSVPQLNKAISDLITEVTLEPDFEYKEISGEPRLYFKNVGSAGVSGLKEDLSFSVGNVFQVFFN